MKTFTKKYFIILLSLLSFFSGKGLSQNVAGGITGSNTPITLTTSGNNIILNNGIVDMTINKTSATVSSLTYSGMSMFASGFYWSWTPNIEYYPANCEYTLVVDPATNGGTYAEVKFIAPYTPTGPDSAAWDVEIHYSLLQGSPGFYAAAILSRPTTYPAYTMGEWRGAIKLNTAVFDWLSVDSTRNKMMATETDWENGTQPTNAPMEVRLLNTGIYSGQYECKYGYSADLGNLNVYGWSSVPYPASGTGDPTGKNVGIWMTLPSLEYYNGGPMKRELTGHLDLVNAGTGDLLLLNMLNGTHYGMGGNFTFAAGEAFQKVYGPFFVYCNKYTGSSTSASEIANTLWQDAQNQAVAEQASWPYSWFNNAAYPQKSGRATVSGTFSITDPGNTTASPSGMWIGLAPSDGGDFQLQAKTYQFWSKINANGSFSIPNIRPGAYNLYAFGTGGRGTFQQSNIALTAGQNLNLGAIKWTPERTGPTVWEIGIPNRDSKEFFNGYSSGAGTPPPYSLWPTSFINYPTQFPNGVNYTVGTSNWATDWNYAQVCNANNNWATSPWTINFTLNNAPTAGTQAALYLALASNYTSHLTITVNGTQIYSNAMANGSDAVIRLGSHGAFYDSSIVFNSNLLKKGANTIILNQVKAAEGNTIEYDYLRLEATGTGNIAPLATITPATTTTFCSGGSVVLNANTGAGYTYQWNKGDTIISGATAASYTAKSSGSYTVTVTADGLSATSLATLVTANPLPTAIITPAEAAFCSGGSVVLNANTGTGLTYQWNNGGTALTGATAASYTAMTMGSYMVVVTDTSTCSATSTAATVTINPLPTATITPATTTTFCMGDSVVLSANTATGLTYQWRNGGTAISGATNTSYSASTVGDYTVTVTNSKNCTITSSAITVNVDPPSSASIAGNDQYITTTTANLAANTPIIGIGTWSTLSGTGIFANAASATSSVSGLSPGANVFQWTISNGACPPSASSVTISVGSSPTSKVISGPTNVIANETQVTYYIPDTAGSTYHWIVPAGVVITSANADSTSITVSFGTAGGNISVIQTNPYGEAASTLSVSVGYPPILQTITGPDSVTANQIGVVYSIPDSAGSVYHWTLPTGSTITSANADSSQITVSFGISGGNISVAQTNAYGKATSSLAVSINIATGVIAGATAATYEVQPNPFSDYTSIIVHSPSTEQITLSIIDVQGVTCYSTSQYYTNQQFTIGRELSADGVYFVQLAFGAELKVLKLVKIK